MGAGSDLPGAVIAVRGVVVRGGAGRMAKRVRAATGVGLLALAGCIDFVAPDLPELGAPVVLQAMLRLEDGRTLRLDALLAPGLDDSGLRRTAGNASIRLQDASLSPDSVLASGTHVYHDELDLVAGDNETIFLEGPRVDGVAAPVPAVRWQVVRRVGADTVRLNAAGELHLTLLLPAGASTPVPDLRQWLVSLTGVDGEAFTISANGAPPASIVVPPQFVPSTSAGPVNVRFAELQSVQLRPAPGDYVALITLDNTIRWTVRP